MKKTKCKIKKRFPDEESAREYLEQQRWHGKAACPRCESPKVRRLPDRHRRIGFWQCNGCRKQFNVRTNSVFQHSNIPLDEWLRTFHLFSVACKKGKASNEISSALEIKLETAWFMSHRIRKAMENENQGILEGTVECDETFIGGLEENKHEDMRLHQGSGTDGKLILWVAAERDGRAVMRVAKDREPATLRKLVQDNIKRNSTVYTDGEKAYTSLPALGYAHGSVNHSKKQYKKGEASTNLAECLWSPLKRGYHGTYQKISHKHLRRYADEFIFRWNTRGRTAMEKLDALVQGAFQGWLPYKELVSGGKPYYVSEKYWGAADELVAARKRKKLLRGNVILI